MTLRSFHSSLRSNRRRMRPILEALEDRVVLDVGDTLMTALQTNLGPGSGTFIMPTERVGDGPFGTRDVDIYQFQARNGSFLEARTTLPPGGQSMDTILRLFNANGTELAVNDDCVGLYSCIDFTFTAPGTYYIGVSGFANFGYNPNQGGSGTDGSTGDYRLSLGLRTPPLGPIVERITPDRSPGPISSLRVRFDRVMNPSTFTTADINSFDGPAGNIPVQNVTPVAGNREFDVTFPMQVITGFYGIDLGPDILDTQGNAMDQDGDDIPGEFDDRFVGTIGIGGPQVNRIDPLFMGARTVLGVRVTFNRAMDTSSVTTDVISVFGPGGQVEIASVTGMGTVFDATFASPQTAPGTYDISVFAGVRDTFGNPLDQNGNLIPGEDPADNAVASFRIVPPGCFDGDSFGYLGCVSDFEDINLEPGQPGVFVILDGQDDGAAAVNLMANTFNFYGVTFTGNNQLFVSTNGLITFGTGNATFTNTDFTTFPGERAIAVLWDDWRTDTSPTDVVLGRFDGNRLIIEWSQVPHFPTSPSTVTFQAILQLNTGGVAGDIRFNYVDLITGDENNNGASATIGIKDLGNQGPRRVLFSFDSPNAFDLLQLRFSVAGGAAAAPGSGDNGTLATLLAQEERASGVVPALAGSLEKGTRNVALDSDPFQDPVLNAGLGKVISTRADQAAAVDALFELDLAGF